MADFNSLNQVTLLGKVGQIYELKHAKDNRLPVITFSLATRDISDKPKSSPGERKETFTTWHYITAFGRSAEFVHNFVKVGYTVLVLGRNAESRWGEGRRDYKVNARQVIMITGTKKQDEEMTYSEGEYVDEEPPQEPDQGGADVDKEDDPPF